MTQALRVAQMFETNGGLGIGKVDEAFLRSQGAAKIGEGIWSFPDASRGQLLSRPISVKDDDGNEVGRCWFEAIQ